MKLCLGDVSDKDRLINAFKNWHGGVFFHIEQCKRITEMLRGESLTNDDKLIVSEAICSFQRYLSDVASIGKLDN